MTTISKQTGRRSLRLTGWDHKSGKGGIILTDARGVTKSYSLDRTSKTPSTETFYFEAPGANEEGYEVTRTPGGWTCGCKGWQYRQYCKHVDALQTLKEKRYI